MTLVVTKPDAQDITVDKKGYFKLPLTFTGDKFEQLQEFALEAETTRLTVQTHFHQRATPNSVIITLAGESQNKNGHPSNEEYQALINQFKETELAKGYGITVILR